MGKIVGTNLETLYSLSATGKPVFHDRIDPNLSNESGSSSSDRINLSAIVQ